MKQLCEKYCRCLSCPAAVLGAVTIISIFALAAALASEIFLGLEPCILCIYQRIPYAVVIALGLAGLALRKNKKLARALIALCGLSFLTNAAIAFYHSGVELHWWKSAVEGCAATFENSGAQSVLENILSAPTARCDEIPWADPLLGLSMANYNVVLCFGLFVVCLLSVVRLNK